MPVVLTESQKFRDDLRRELIEPGNLELTEVIVIGKNGKMITRFDSWDGSNATKLTAAITTAAAAK